MTTPHERTRALKQAKEILEAILSCEEWPVDAADSVKFVIDADGH